ncbi:HRQ family protein [Metarhizium robertsii ARSEF 23]|uniref:HRQ family protein n=1 Tax=Metarhizium robertsii (strain ARSEF 23 / ATCC MYA-3075) TaxID=655844 RepID=E9FBG1_METRA|nr:HRQ family protein [Metarhizium robertsii ARSEF 23]EFY94899.2 HRQ family protein [Metarhizium robertsii ARSEF 23]
MAVRCVLPIPLSGKAPPKKGPDIDYFKIFPPSQRQFLPEATLASSIAEKDHLDTRDLSISAKPILRLDADYRLADPSTYIYSGFTVGDIKALGDFPDYAKLSGVPLPLPLKDFNVDSSPPRPYRPFRWPYHQTMSFKKLEPDYWLELEDTYRERIHQRQSLYKKHGKEVLQALPGSELTCKELMEMVL